MIKYILILLSLATFTLAQTTHIKGILKADSLDVGTLITSDTTLANKTLSNLGTTAINTNLIPTSDYYIGNSTTSWSNIWSTYYTLKSSANPYYIRLSGTATASSKTITLQNKDGTIMLTSDTVSLDHRINQKPDSNDVQSLVEDSVALRLAKDFRAAYSNMTPTTDDYIPINRSGTNYQTTLDALPISTLTQAALDAMPDSTIINNLIEANEDSSGSAIIGTAATLDSIITDYWAGTLGGSSTTRTKSTYDILEMAYIDTFLIFWVDDAITIDSIKGESTDSVKIQMKIDGSTESSLFAYGGGYINGNTTLSTFADNTLAVNDKAELYFTYIGDTATRLKLKIYWRYN